MMHMTEDDDLIELKSKSQLKREATALQKLGETLVELSAADLTKVPLPESLLDAVMKARQIKARGGLKRQLQYIGKLMRTIDAAPIYQAVDRLQGRDQAAAAHFQRLERLRDSLIEEGDKTLGEVLEQYPDADRQHLRQLIRNAIKERESGKSAGAGKALFRYLRELAEAEAS